MSYDSEIETTPLVYDSNKDCSTVKKVLFIDQSVGEFSQYVNNDTFAIQYSFTSSSTKLTEVLRSRFSQIERIGFVFHYSAQPSFMDLEYLFVPSDFTGGSISKGLELVLEILLDFDVQHVDFLACKTLLDTNWRQYFDLLEGNSNAVVSASDDNTGNLKYGGDWILENTMTDVKTIYFNDLVGDYASLLTTHTEDYITYNLDSGNQTAVLASFLEKPAGETTYEIPCSINVSGVDYDVNQWGYSSNLPGARYTRTSDPPSTIKVEHIIGTGTATTELFIEDHVFIHSYLKTIIFPKRNIHIDRGAFADECHLETMTFSMDHTLTLGDWPFKDCRFTSDVTFPVLTNADIPEWCFTSNTQWNGNKLNFYGMTLPSFPVGNDHGVPEIGYRAGAVLGDGTLASSSNKPTGFNGIMTEWSPPVDYNLPSLPTQTNNNKYKFNQLSNHDLTDTSIVGTTTSEKKKFSKSLLKEIYSTYTDLSGKLFILNTGAILPGYNNSLSTDTTIFNADKTIANSYIDNINFDTLKDSSFFVLMDTSGDTITLPSGSLNKSVTITQISESSFSVTTPLETVVKYENDTYSYNGLSFTLGSIYGSVVSNEFSLFPTESILSDKYYNVFYTVSKNNPSVLNAKFYDQSQTLISTQDISFNGKTMKEMLAFLENSAANPYAIGKTRTGFRSMDLTYGAVYKKALKDSQQQSLMTYVNKTFKNVYSSAVTVYEVKVNGSMKYMIDDVEQPNLVATQIGTYVFDQSDPSNDGHRLKFRNLSDSTTSYTTNVTHEGTPGTPNSYSIIDVTQDTPDLQYYCENHTSSMYGEFKTLTDLTSYRVKVETNVLGDPVFALSPPGTDEYYNQIDVSFGAGSKFLFDVSDPTMADISFVFGTVIDNSSTILDSFVTYQDGVVILDICSGYVGESLKYFEDTSAGMGYVEVSTTSSTVTTTTINFADIAGETKENTEIYLNQNFSELNPLFVVPSGDTIVFNTVTTNNYTVPSDGIQFFSHPGTNGKMAFKINSNINGTCTIRYGEGSTHTPNTTYVKLNDLEVDSTTGEDKTYTFNVSIGDEIKIDELGVALLYSIVLSGTFPPSIIHTISISGDPAVFYIDGSANPNLTFTSGETYVFDLSHNSNAGNTLVLGTVPDSSTNLIDYQTIVGTPGQPGAYTTFTASGETVYYYSFETPDMGYEPPTYIVKTDTNVLGDTVFSIQKPGESVFYIQPDLSFGAGTTAKFNVSIIEGSYTLVFGTTIDDPLTIISDYAVKTDGIIDLVIPSEYNGVPLRYFDISNANMGYVTHDIPIQSSFTSIATDSNVYGIKCSANGQYVFAKSGNNVLKSNDYGLTYSVTDTKVGGNYIVVSEDGKDVCVWNGTTFATSNDYGITFTKHISSIGITYISATGQHIVLFGVLTPYISNDYGATSSSLTTMTGSKSYQDVQISATGQYIMFSTNEENGVRVSNNYGATFSVKGSNCPYGRGLIMSDSGQYAMAPTAGNASSIYTTDYGNTWNVFTHGADNTILPAVNGLSITQALNHNTNISFNDMIYYSYNGIYQYYSDKISSTTRYHYYSNDSGLNFSSSNDSRFNSSFMLCLDDYSNIYASVGSSITRSFTTIPPTIINVTVSNEVFLFDGTLSKPQMNFNNTHTYVFKQDDHTNTGNTLVLGYLPDYIDSSNYIPNQLIVGTAGQSGAFTRFTANTDIVYYFSNETPNMGYKPSDNYFVKVENNLLDEPVYSFKSPGSLIYTKQPIIPIIPSTHLLFDVSEVDDSYNLVFGTVVDDPTTIQTQYMKKIQNTIILSVPYSSTGSLTYFDSSYNNMGYKETLPIVSSTVHQTLILETNLSIYRIFFNADCTIAFVYFVSNGACMRVYESDGINWNIQSVNSSINDSNYSNTIDIHGGLEFVANGKGDKLFGYTQAGSYFTAQYYYNGTEWNRSSVNLSQYGSTYIYGGYSTASYYGSITFTSELTGWDLSGTFAHNARNNHQNEYAMRTFGQYEGTIMNPYNTEWWMVTDMNHEGDVIVVSALVYKYDNTYSKTYGSLTEENWSPIGGLDGLLGGSGTHAVFGIGHNTVALSKGFTFNQSSEFYDPTIKLRVAFAAPGNDDYKTNAGTLRIYEYDELKTTIDTDPLSSDFGPKHWRRIGQDIHGDYAQDYYGGRMQFNRNGSMIIARTNNNEIKIYTYLDDINLWTHMKTITSDNLEGVFASGIGNYPINPAGGLQYRLHETDNKILIYETDVSNIVNTYDIGTADLAINIEVTVSNEVFMFHGSEKPNITFDENTMYIFDQSDPTNAGNTLVLGTVYDSSTNLIDYQTIVGTPGQPGAYTSFTALGETVFYYSFETPNMGLPPPNITDDLYVHYDFEFPLYDPTGTERTDGLTGGNSDVRTYNKAYDSSTNSDVSYNGYLSNFGNGSAHLDSTIKKIGNSSLKVNESPVRSENAWKLNNDQGYSICFWMKEDSANGPLFGMDNLNGAPFFVIEYNSSTLTVNNNGTTLTYNISALTMTNWNHIAFTISPDSSDITWKLYINGSLVNTKTDGNYLVPQNIRSDYPDDLIFLVDVGARPASSQYKGYFDDFRFYKTELSSAQVDAVYTYSG